MTLRHAAHGLTVQVDTVRCSDGFTIAAHLWFPVSFVSRPNSSSSVPAQAVHEMFSPATIPCKQESGRQCRTVLHAEHAVVSALPLATAP
jgi:hypothetical protein